MRSHAGFSGSPVFLIIPANSFRGEFGDTSLEDNTTRFRLLGIDTGHVQESLPVRQRGSVPDESTDLFVRHNSDVAIVAPIWNLIDVLDRDEVVQGRQALADEYFGATE
jgi:hypothetical protein